MSQPQPKKRGKKRSRSQMSKTSTPSTAKHDAHNTGLGLRWFNAAKRLVAYKANIIYLPPAESKTSPHDKLTTVKTMIETYAMHKITGNDEYIKQPLTDINKKRDLIKKDIAIKIKKCDELADQWTKDPSTFPQELKDAVSEQLAKEICDETLAAQEKKKLILKQKSELKRAELKKIKEQIKLEKEEKRAKEKEHKAMVIENASLKKNAGRLEKQKTKLEKQVANQKERLAKKKLIKAQQKAVKLSKSVKSIQKPAKIQKTVKRQKLAVAAENQKK